MAADPWDQHGYDVRCEWGQEGLERLTRACPVVVIVDVLRFTTAVSVAVEAGAEVLPYRWMDDAGAVAYASQHDAVLAPPGLTGLSPAALATIAPGTRIVLPSANGSALSFAARDAGASTVLAACLRNASAAGRVAGAHESVAVVPAGERWLGGSGPLRPAVEDMIGAGAVIAAMPGAMTRSPEAAAAQAAFLDAAGRGMASVLAGSASGRELVDRGFGDDVAVAAEVDASSVVPVLDGVAFSSR